ncbi:lysophospholipid acyltransferase family protein [Sphingomonas aracearum]|uniref:1-acyl-sn-glycerol-3-phosphate acyltransferase n=1 Tax=Sphingomonas aracearum TaxID=2283317 RepID=A0A369W0Y5_9SPHN|nr:lysophospholipid acyltransferase family protein [Sphingomonas aracearum]RDE05741.1 1-acyl-sn-glycerol-3-phosphate acyltransferase [Sphingomonas aracearum]
MGTLRLCGRLLALLLLLSVALPLHGCWRLLRRRSPWPRRFLRAVAWVIGARVRIVGAARTHDVFLVANHVSWTDIPILAGATGTAFVAKAELADAPLVGWLAALNHTVFIRRTRAAVTEQVQDIAAALAQGWPLTLFPEGTTGDGRTLLPFKPALLQVASPPPPGVQVQPVLLDYGAATPDLAWAGEEGGASHARRVLRRPGSFAVTLRFLEPFVPGDDRKATAAEVRRRMEAVA